MDFDPCFVFSNAHLSVAWMVRQYLDFLTLLFFQSVPEADN